MKIAYVAGFFAPALNAIQSSVSTLVAERSVVFIPQRSDRQIDLIRLKSELFDQTAKGAQEILFCVFVFRGQEHVSEAIRQIANAAMTRHDRLIVKIQHFKNAQDVSGILRAIGDFGPTRLQALPGGLDELAPWADYTLKGRLHLHPRALRGAKQSTYGDVHLVYASLNLLGNEYWEMRTCSEHSKPRCGGSFSNKLGTLGLELSPSISSTRAGEEGDAYWVRYPDSRPRRRFLDLHLKKGSDRDARNCLRVYFFWDEVLSVCVVGWLTSHLGTRQS